MLIKILEKREKDGVDQKISFCVNSYIYFIRNITVNFKLIDLNIFL